MKLLQDAAAWLSRMEIAAAGETVTYTRGAVSRAITAVFGQTIATSNAEVAVRVQTSDADALIDVSELTDFTEPLVGDRILRGGLIYELINPNTGEPPWRYTDATRTKYRLHLTRK